MKNVSHFAQLEKPEITDYHDGQSGHERKELERNISVDPGMCGLGAGIVMAAILSAIEKISPKSDSMNRPAIQIAMMPAGTWTASFLSESMTNAGRHRCRQTDTHAPSATSPTMNIMKGAFRFDLVLNKPIGFRFAVAANALRGAYAVLAEFQGAIDARFMDSFSGAGFQGWFSRQPVIHSLGLR